VWVPVIIRNAPVKAVYSTTGNAPPAQAAPLTGNEFYTESGLSLIPTETFSEEHVNTLLTKYVLGKRASSISDFSYSRSYNMVATAYTAGPESTGKSPGMRGYGITASGMRVQPGVVAVDPRVIPLGTRLYVQGYGYSIAADTGSAIKGKRIDVYIKSLSEAYKWGRRTVAVYVLK